MSTWYFKAGGDSYWANTSNWWSGSGGTGSRPASAPWTIDDSTKNDNLSLAVGEVTIPNTDTLSSNGIGNGFVISGVCNIGLTFTRNVHGGIYTGGITASDQIIYGGTFGGCTNNGVINGGTFSGNVINNLDTPFPGDGVINGGSFVKLLNHGVVNGGTFTGYGSDIWNPDGRINGGYFPNQARGLGNCAPFPDTIFMGEELSESSSSSSSTFIRSSSSYGRTYLSAGEVYTIVDSVTEFEYIGDNNTSATVILGALPFSFKVANISGSFVWDYAGSNPYMFTYIGETINIVNNGSMFAVSFDGIGSLLFTVTLASSLTSDQVYVAMASREYGQGRVFIHTDRIGALKTGHGDNSKDFWRGILEWSTKKTAEDFIRVGLIVNTPSSAADKIQSMNPISLNKFSISDLLTKDLSKYDCLYVVGLPSAVSSAITQKIALFVENGGGLVLEYPNRSGEYINILQDIDNLYCYSSERTLTSNAYWTIDGGQSYVFSNSAQIAFMSTLRQYDFSDKWIILMTNVPNVVTTTTTTSVTNLLIFDGKSSAEFSISYTSAIQKGIVFIEFGEETYASSSYSSSSSSSSF